MSRRFLSVLTCLGAGLLVGTTASAQLVTDFNPPRTNCCLAGTARSLADQLQDWNQLGRYHAADQQLMKAPVDPKRVVFLGDSITDIWRLEDSFPGKPYVNRGISGQTTPQMLVRMYPDVIDLKPAALIILAGTNDVAQNTGPETIEMIEENLMAMTELAQAHGIKVILCALTPISDHPKPPAGAGRAGRAGRGGGRGRAGGPPPRPQSEQRPPAQILQLNAWIKDYTAKVHAGFADYYSAVVDADGSFRDGYTNDGLHPNTEGFTLLAPVAEAAIEKALP